MLIPGPHSVFSLELTKDERRLILSEASLSPELEQRLQGATVEGNSVYVRFALDDLHEIAEAVAAEANRCPNKRKQKQWDRIYERIVALVRSRPDESDLPGRDAEPSPFKLLPPDLTERVQRVLKTEQFNTIDDLNARIAQIMSEYNRRPQHESDLPGRDAEPSPFKLLPPDLTERVQRVLKTEQFNTIDDLNARIAQIMSEYNRRPQQEMGGLSPEQVSYLIYSDWEDPEGAVQLNENLTLEDLQHSEFLVNARTFLGAVSEAGKVKATAAGNLNRKFVAQMLDALVLEDGFRDVIYAVCKVINEKDVWALHILRVLFDLAGLLKRRRGFFTLTRKGLKLFDEEQAGALFVLLFRTHFKKFNLSYRDPLPDNPGLQATIAFSLLMLSKHAARWTRPKDLAHRVLLPTVRDAASSYTDPDFLLWQVEARIIWPLESFGLLERRKLPTESKYLEPYKIRKTPLYDRFLSFRSPERQHIH